MLLQFSGESNAEVALESNCMADLVHRHWCVIILDGKVLQGVSKRAAQGLVFIFRTDS